PAVRSAAISSGTRWCRPSGRGRSSTCRGSRWAGPATFTSRSGWRTATLIMSGSAAKRYWRGKEPSTSNEEAYEAETDGHRSISGWSERGAGGAGGQVKVDQSGGAHRAGAGDLQGELRDEPGRVRGHRQPEMGADWRRPVPQPRE